MSVYKISQGLIVQVARLAQICEREELPRGTLRLLQLRNVNGFYEKYPYDQKDNVNDDSNNYEKKLIWLF